MIKGIKLNLEIIVNLENDEEIMEFLNGDGEENDLFLTTLEGGLKGELMDLFYKDTKIVAKGEYLNE